MPYEIRKQDGKFAVWKKGAMGAKKGARGGKLMKAYAKRDDAVRYLRALYANEKDPSTIVAALEADTLDEVVLTAVSPKIAAAEEKFKANRVVKPIRRPDEERTPEARQVIDQLKAMTAAVAEAPVVDHNPIVEARPDGYLISDDPEVYAGLVARAAALGIPVSMDDPLSPETVPELVAMVEAGETGLPVHFERLAFDAEDRVRTSTSQDDREFWQRKADEHRAIIAAGGYDESKHKRAPKEVKGGGRWVSMGTSTQTFTDRTGSQEDLHVQLDENGNPVAVGVERDGMTTLVEDPVAAQEAQASALEGVKAGDVSVTENEDLVWVNESSAPESGIPTPPPVAPASVAIGELGGSEFHLIGDQVYRVPAGAEVSSVTGLPMGARWESSAAHWDTYKGMEGTVPFMATNPTIPIPKSAGVEGPFTYPSGWQGKYDPVEGRYLGMDDIYMPADFDPARDAGSAMVQPSGPARSVDVKNTLNLANNGGEAELSLVPTDVLQETMASHSEVLTPDGRENVSRALAARAIPPDRARRVAGLANLGAEGGTRADGPSHMDYSPEDLRATLASPDAELTPSGRANIERTLALYDKPMVNEMRSARYDQAVQDELARSGSHRVNAFVPEGVSLPDPGGEPYSVKHIPVGGYGLASVVRSDRGNLGLQWGNAKSYAIFKALPPDEQARILNEAIGRTVQASGDLELSGLTASAAGMAPDVPPAEWFEDPELDGPTPLTVTPEGRVFGHVASWGTCHTGIQGRCVQPPASKSQYAYFNLASVRTTDGVVPAGKITMDTGHAPLAASSKVAASHYDHTGVVAADVRAGEDEHGIWISGSVRPDLDANQARALERAAVSGDWRRIGGAHEMVGLLAVNVPGFPIPRAQAALTASGDAEIVTALVAAGIVCGCDGEDADGLLDELVVDTVDERTLAFHGRPARR